MRASSSEPPNVVERIDSTLGDDRRVALVASEQSLGYRDISHESMQVAIVYADERRADFLRERELGRIVRFDQRRHPKLARERLQRSQLTFFQHRGDHQNGIRAGRARFVNLVRLKGEYLTQQRDV